jgi:hypothetical protein
VSGGEEKGRGEEKTNQSRGARSLERGRLRWLLSKYSTSTLWGRVLLRCGNGRAKQEAKRGDDVDERFLPPLRSSLFARVERVADCTELSFPDRASTWHTRSNPQKVTENTRLVFFAPLTHSSSRSLSLSSSPSWSMLPPLAPISTLSSDFYLLRSRGRRPRTRAVRPFAWAKLLQRIIRSEVLEVIDIVVTYERYKSLTVNVSVVRPLSLKLSRGSRPPSALIYARLVCRVYFLDVASDDLALAYVCCRPDAETNAKLTFFATAESTPRAPTSELLAVKLLSAYGTAPSSLELLHILTASLNPPNGATENMFSEDEGVNANDMARMLEWGKGESSNALELGIFSKAKRFVRSSLVQQVRCCHLHQSSRSLSLTAFLGFAGRSSDLSR